MKAIMYHYVREDVETLPHFKHLHIDDFEQQLDFFGKEYGFVKKEEFLASFKTGMVPEGVVLTFDDGVADHYKFVYPALKKRNLWGIFYVPTKNFSGQILDVHRIHLLLGGFDAEVLTNSLNKLVTLEMLTDIGRKEFTGDTYKSQSNSEATLAFKRTLNYTIGYEYRSQILDTLMFDFFGPDKKFHDFYASPEMLREMALNDMIIGSHSRNHFVMSKLSEAEQSDEIKGSFLELEQVISDPKVKTFCYPYGGFHSFNETTEKILTEQGCLFSFNVEARDISNEDILGRPQALPRYDCNAFPFGKCRQ